MLLQWLLLLLPPSPPLPRLNLTPRTELQIGNMYFTGLVYLHYLYRGEDPLPLHSLGTRKRRTGASAGDGPGNSTRMSRGPRIKLNELVICSRGFGWRTFIVLLHAPCEATVQLKLARGHGNSCPINSSSRASSTRVHRRGGNWMARGREHSLQSKLSTAIREDIQGNFNDLLLLDPWGRHSQGR